MSGTAALQRTQRNTEGQAVVPVESLLTVRGVPYRTLYLHASRAVDSGVGFTPVERRGMGVAYA